MTNKNIIITTFVVSTFASIGCNSKTEEVDKVELDSKEVVNDTTQLEITNATIENQLSTEEIDQIRNEIEGLPIEPIEISTANLREKIKQKWSKIHVYVQNDKVVKIKTYPYTDISKRTEEFYANEDGLVLVVIQDNGEEPKGKPKTEIDKMYYFSHGALLNELNNEKEEEYSIKESDAEELLSEFNEYLQIYNASIQTK